MGLPPQALGRFSQIHEAGLETYLMDHARLIRFDELLVFTPYALSQLSHEPRFPVINTNIGKGQNMLVVPHTPVWHIATLARPATWGYFFLGAQRGLAWYWWFQIFACFTVLYLLFEILLKGRQGLAAFGAFWVGASAYFVCWSHAADYLVFFAGLGCLAAYHLLASEKRSIQVISAILLGLSFPGFVMIMYPPWQVGAGYFFALLFVLLFIRDKLYLSLRRELKYRLGLLALAVVIAGGLSLLWLSACLPDLKIMSNTVYPGRRVSTGGDYSFGLLFKGMYNLFTVATAPPQGLGNESEASSFYYFFPAIMFAALVSKRIARKLGLIGWGLIAYIVAMILFVLVGVPESIAKLTLLSYIPSNRADLTIGLASILLCMHLLSVMTQEKEAEGNPAEASLPLRVAAFAVFFYIVQSLFLMKQAGGFPLPQYTLLIASLSGLIAYCLLVGKVRLFCTLTASLVVATTALFNPLATNLDHIYDSEMARAITSVNQQSPDRPFWVSYGGVFPGVLVEILGGRSLAGIQWPPQLDVWHTLDPDRRNEQIYNMYAEVSFDYLADQNSVAFKKVQPGTMRVQISPYHPALKSLGVRYVLLLGEAQKQVDTSKLTPVYHSSADTFSIFELPPAPPQP
jgi:hypothetical protein